MFKTVALKQEIQSLTKELSDYKSRNIELAGENEKQKLDYNGKIRELEKRNIEIRAEKYFENMRERLLEEYIVK